MKKYVLAIDQGTTSCRAILFDKQGRMVAKSGKEFTQIYPVAGLVEHDPLEILSCQLEVLRSLLRKNNINPDSIDSIGVTNQRETVVVWNKENGKPIYNAIVWQCRRTSDICEDLKKQGLTDLIRAKTGLVIDAYFSATKIQWILDNVEGARSLAAQGLLLCGTIDTWLIWNLTGAKSHVTDYSNASRTMLFNIDTLNWDPELLELFRIPLQLLPTVKSSSDDFGFLDSNVLGVEIPITGVAGDQQAALFGQGCFSRGMAKNTYGTGCFMLMNTGSEKIYSKNNLLTTLACGLDGKAQYALEGSVFIGGSVVKWLRDDMKLIQEASETDEIAARIHDTKGVYFVPAFVGLGAPYWDTYARGVIVGLTQGVGREQIIRAALESIAYQTKDVLSSMALDSGIDLLELRVDGGASANAFLMQFQADILGVNVVRPRNIEATAQGAALLAALKTEFWLPGVLDIALNEKETFVSQMNEEERLIKYNDWKNAVRRCR